MNKNIFLVCFLILFSVFGFAALQTRAPSINTTCNGTVCDGTNWVNIPDSAVNNDITLTNITQITNRSYGDLQNTPFIPSTAEWDANYAAGNADRNNLFVLKNPTANQTISGFDLNLSGANAQFNMSNNGDINGDVATFNSFVGNGANLTNIPASSITAGTFGSGNYTIDGELDIKGFTFSSDTGWNLTITGDQTAYNSLLFGSNDTIRGNIVAYGHTTGSVYGGILQAQTAADYDSVINAYVFKAITNDLQIGRSDDVGLLTYDGDLGTWNFTNANGLTLAGTLTASKVVAGGYVNTFTNTDAGTGSYTSIETRNAGTASDSTRLLTMGTGYTTAGAYVQDGGVLVAEPNLAGGLSLVARHASGDVRIYAGGATAGDLVATFDDTQGTTLTGSLDVAGLSAFGSTASVTTTDILKEQHNFGNITASTLITGSNILPYIYPSASSAAYNYGVSTTPIFRWYDGYTQSGRLIGYHSTPQTFIDSATNDQTVTVTGIHAGFYSVPQNYAGTGDTINTSNIYGYYAADVSKTGSGTITNAYGLYVEPQTKATNNYGAYFGSDVIVDADLNAVGLEGSIPLSIQSGKIGHLGSSGASIDGSQNRFYGLFDANVTECMDLGFTMPQTYSATQTLYFDLPYTMAVDSGGTRSVELSVSVMATSSGDAVAIETDSFDTNNTLTSTIPATVGYMKRETITLTNKDSVAPLDFVTLRVCRLGVSGNDTAYYDLEMLSPEVWWAS